MSLTCGPGQRSTRPDPNWAGWAWIRAWIRARLGPTRVNLWLRRVGCWIPIGFCPRARHSRMVHGGLSTVGLWTTAWFIVDQVHLLPISHGSQWNVRTARLLLLLTPFSSVSPTAVLSSRGELARDALRWLGWAARVTTESRGHRERVSGVTSLREAGVRGTAAR